MDTASLIFFAIQASIRLSQAGFKAYVDATRNRDLLLPLPKAFKEPSYPQARAAFLDGALREFANPTGANNPLCPTPDPRVVELLKLTNPDLAQQQRLIQLAMEYYRCKRALDNGSATTEAGVNLSPEEAISLVTIRSWGDIYMEARPLQRIAGTLFEIGIDFARQNSEIFTKSSSSAKTIQDLLAKLDEVDFATADLYQLPEKLFVAALETVAANPDICAKDSRVQVLVQTSAQRVSELVVKRFEEQSASLGTATAKFSLKEQLVEVGELTFRGVLDAAGHMVIADPGRFLGVHDKASKEMVGAVGTSVLDLILGEHGVNFDPLACRAGVERLLQSALDVVSRHPDLIVHESSQQRSFLQMLIAQTAQELCGTEHLLKGDMLIEVLRLILMKSGGNLELLWPEKTRNKPPIHILIIVAKIVVQSISRKDSNGLWRPVFGRPELLTVVEAACDAVNSNPIWITGADTQRQEALCLILSEIVEILRSGKVRVSDTTAAAILVRTIRSLALRETFFNDLPHGSIAQHFASSVVDAIVTTIFGLPETEGKWSLCRTEFILQLTEVVMQEMEKLPAQQKSLDDIKNFIAWIAQEATLGRVPSLNSLAEEFAKRPLPAVP